MKEFELYVEKIMKKTIIELSILLVFVINCENKNNETLPIMTFNIRYGTANDGENSWENRKTILFDCLKKYQPDILGTQEGLDFQHEEIIEHFPNWKIFGVGRYHGIELPDRPHESMGGESCKIYYDPVKFELIKEGTFWHSDSPDIPGSKTWGNSLPRVVTWGIFQSTQSDKKFVVMNTHYHWDEPYRKNTTRLILKKWKEIAVDLPTILMGDFNLAPTSESHQLFCGNRKNENGPQGEFIDYWQKLNKPESERGTFNGFKIDKMGDRIDWILGTSDFVAKEIEIVTFNKNGQYPSDHFPVAAKLSF